MGVKDLWSILSPVCERKPLWELQGKSVAIDLSGWVCDSQNLTEKNVQPRMYLRNLFFRTSCLLLMDVRPIFILEGTAPALKHDTMSRRNQQHYGRSQSLKSGEHRVGKTGSRKRFMSVLKQCKELLELMGVACMQSQGEAEAMCARLNMAGVVDGCISQDGDCFLYGAQTVYRNFTISHSGTGGSASYSVDMYKMETIVDRLSLCRRKLVALSILCGCDYNEKGVVGVGKETALKFLNSVENEDVLDRFQRWCTDPHFEVLEAQRVSMGRKDLCEKCGHKGRKPTHDRSGCVSCGFPQGCIQDEQGLRGMDTESRKLMLAELNLRHKALQDPKFPYQHLVDEFMVGSDEVSTPDWVWRMPQLDKFIMLAWPEDYALEKFLPLAARWHLQQSVPGGSLTAQAVRRRCTRKGVACLEVEWSTTSPRSGGLLATVEPAHLVEAAYPLLVQAFLDRREADKCAGKQKSKVKKRKVKTKEQTKSMPHICTTGQDRLCKFLSLQDNDDEVTAIERKLAALDIDHDKENEVPAVCMKKQRNPAKQKESRVKLQSLLLKLDQGQGRDGARNHFPIRNKLPSPNKKITTFNMDTISCVNDSLDFSCCSKCEDDESMDLSSIINSIVGGEHPMPAPATEIRPRQQATQDGAIGNKTLQVASGFDPSTTECSGRVNFSLGTSNFLAVSDVSFT